MSRLVVPTAPVPAVAELDGRHAAAALRALVASLRIAPGRMEITVAAAVRPRVYELQLDGQVTTLEAARDAARTALADETN